MMDNLDCFALMLAGESRAACMSSAISSEEVVIVYCRGRQRELVFGAAWPWKSWAKSNWRRVDGTPNHDLAGKPALMKSISTSTLKQKKIHSRGNDVVAGVTAAPG